jgi:hypothetical protein
MKIRETDWFKRRLPTPQPKAIDVKVHNLVLEQNHMCKMTAYYDDGSVFQLNARVNQNDIKGTWTVHGIDHLGHSVLVDIVDE